MLATAIPNQHLNTISTNNCFYAALAPAQVAPPTIASATAAAAAVGSATAAATTCLPAISPTFIEHKYSANTFKEKFYANLRQHYSSSNNNKLKQLKTNNIVSSPCDNGNKKNAYRGKGGMLNSIDRKVVGGDGGGGGNSSFTEIGGNSINNDKSNKIPTFSNNGITSNGETAIAVCSMKKQLNENVKNNLYKKFIN